MIVCAGVSLAGLLVTALFVEDRRNVSMDDDDDDEADASATREWTPAGISSQ